MFLEKIEILGFKSFANKTVLEFPRPGKGCPLITENRQNNHQLTNDVCGFRLLLGQMVLANPMWPTQLGGPWENKV